MPKPKKSPGHMKIEIRPDGSVVSVEPDELEIILYNAHEREAKKKRATFYNEGWAQTDYGVCSKTSLGYLDSEVNPRTKRVTHVWSGYNSH